MRLRYACAALLAFHTPAFAEADLEGFWNLNFQSTPDAELLAKLPPGTAVIDDAGAPEFPRMEFGGLELTPAALQRAQTWNPEDEMTLAKVCQPPSIVYALQGPFPFEIDQTADVIIFRYEYYDQVRLVYMDGRGHPGSDVPHTKMGHSIGRWDGDELVVDTTHIAASTITNNGLDHSDGIHMVERYKLSEDGTRLMASQWFEDSEVLENTGGRYIEWRKQPGQHIFPYECDPTFVLEYQNTGE